MKSPLLSPEFAQELEALRRLLQHGARSGGSGAMSARLRGRGAEFEEHRPYAAGDDIGRLDWLAFARTGQPVSKEHRADEDTVLCVLLDASASLDFGAPRKFDVATRIAASLAYLSLSIGERTELVVATRQGPLRAPAHRGKAALGLVLEELAAIVPGGPANLAEAVSHVVRVSPRPRALVVLSDFFDDGPVVEALLRARHARHEVTLVQLLAPEEISPTVRGDVALTDSETGDVVELSADAATLAAYTARLERLFAELRGFARRSGSSYVRASTAEPRLAVIRRILGSGTD